MNIAPAFGIYIHWPFCAKKCPYCDFNSHVQDNIDQDIWLNAYLNELRHYANETSERLVTSVFFGGGTPSLMAPRVIEAILAEIQRLWPCSDTIEITAEANPSSSEIQQFQDFRQAGINRLSIGVQSFNDPALRFLGRRHDAGEAKKAIEAATTVFERFSFDLIYALPGQTPDIWQKELKEALSLAGGHLSLYQLTIEPGTEFHKARVEAADEEIGSTLFEITQELMTEAGLPAYEISNHAKPSQESRHNLVYWRGQDYLGIGPGAHGRLTGNYQTEMMHNYREPNKWLERVASHGFGQQKRTVLSAEERRDEIILMSLRLQEGLSSAHFKALTGLNLADQLDPDRLNALENEGFLSFNDNILKATPEGRQRLNAVLAHLLA
ncbi:MAG: coproporphyrinogen III oxidase [Rhodospirillaceae bacterium]|jgi:putative oxygen-independent coproporphyrinogen III oxidase|nr:coproporphyrinogen III oxidase [Rhodospirillaceae bacterium]MBT4939695.1 coproporphyrinogen III oxidase [Rhodospirillaceae bacterium]MBT7957175.1 coproporphyrinogen III oxidase [Rhodospirillaceae bacterium]